jgi:hypothetical protein
MGEMANRGNKRIRDAGNGILRCLAFYGETVIENCRMNGRFAACNPAMWCETETSGATFDLACRFGSG